MTDNEREAFEEFAERRLLPTIRNGDSYNNGKTQSYWLDWQVCWQAAKADSAPKLTEEEAVDIAARILLTDKEYRPNRRATEIIQALAAAGMEFKE